jgi:hypothetical protein
MTDPQPSIMRGTLGLEFAFAIMWIALLVGLAQGKAPLRHLLLSPLITLPLMLFNAILLAIVHPMWYAVGVERGGKVEFWLGAMLSVLLCYVAGRLLAAHVNGTPGPRHLRGAVVSAIERLTARGTDRGRPPALDGITVADVPITSADETKHFKIIGSTGTGKSTAIQEILAAAVGRGDRAIIADPDGGYLRRFYEPDRDVILNPFDPDARKWDLFGEITTAYDVDQLTRSLIPDAGGRDPVWSGYARTVLSAVIQQAINVNRRSDAELVRLLNQAHLDELRTLLPGTSAEPFLHEGNEKMFGSARSVAASAIDTLKYTVAHKAEPLSVRQWVRDGAARQNGGSGGILFFPYKAGEIAALASMISAWMRLGIFQALDQEEGDQRLWFVVDELDALGAIDGLKDALARLRKFGGRCVLGFQSIAQVSGTYGKSVAETIVENCGNTLILRCSASEHGGTSEFASKLIGQREVLHTTYSKTRRVSEWLASVTSSQQLRIEPAVMASEIERLADLTGYLKVASVPDWYSVRLTPFAGEVRPRPRRQTPATGAPGTPAATVDPGASAIRVATPTQSKASVDATEPRGNGKRPRKPRSAGARAKRSDRAEGESSNPNDRAADDPPGGPGVRT